MPHAGTIASAGSPCGARSPRNRWLVAAITGSPPLVISRRQDRSQERPEMSSARSLTIAMAKLGAQVLVARYRSAQSNHSSGSARKCSILALTCRQRRKTSRML
ncbi:hypothetical protein STENM327S_01941 [Streptomyces tendae]